MARRLSEEAVKVLRKFDPGFNSSTTVLAKNYGETKCDVEMRICTGAWKEKKFDVSFEGDGITRDHYQICGNRHLTTAWLEGDIDKMDEKFSEFESLLEGIGSQGARIGRGRL